MMRGMLWCHQSPWPLSSITRVWGPWSNSMFPMFFFPKWNDCWQDTGTSGSVAAGLFSNSGKWAAFVPLLPTFHFLFEKFPLPGSVLFLQRCRGAVKMFFQLQGRTRIMGWLSNSSVGIVAGLRKREKASWSTESCSFACFTSGWDGWRIGDATPVVSGSSISTSRSEARRRLARWQVKIRQSVSFHLKPKKTTGWWTVDGYVIFWTSSFINQAPKADTDLIAWCSAAAFLHRKEGRKNRVTCLFD